MKNFKVENDGIYSSIVRTRQPIGQYVYATFAEAKKELKAYHKERIAQFKQALSDANKLTIKDIN